jgi:hypothetical protein
MTTGMLSARLARGIAFAAATLAVVFLFLDTMWASSVDLAHHYGLVYWLTEHFAMPTAIEPTLREMSTYPPISHGIAAVLGVALHSPMLGLHVASLLALALLWLAVLAILLAFRDGRAVASILILAGLVLLNRLTLGVDLHGREIVGNYFYAQFVAQAFLFLVLFAAILVERRAGVVAAIVVMALGVLVISSTHLLAAVELLGVTLGIIVIAVAEAMLRNRGRRGRTIVLGIIACVAVIGITLSHPSFAVMAAISANDGGLEIAGVSYPVGIFVVCVLVLAASLLLFAGWARAPHRVAVLPAKYLAVYGAAVAALCLLQFVLHLAGYGSPYAVKKYGFALTTILVVEIAALLGGLLARPGWASARHGMATAAAILALFAVVVGIMPRQGTFDVSDLVSVEQHLIALERTVVPTSTAAPVIAIGVFDGSRTIDMAFSMAILGTSKVEAIKALFLDQEILDPTRYAYIVSARDNLRYGAAECPSLAPGDFSIVTGACIAERLVRASDCRLVFDFSETGTVPASLLAGFSHPEPEGRWTEGKSASFQCVRQPGDTLRSVRIALLPFVHGDVGAQRLAVRLNGTELGSFERAGAAEEGGEIRLDIPPELNAEIMRLDFEIPDATSPLAAGLNTDSRELGFKIREIAFE